MKLPRFSIDREGITIAAAVISAGALPVALLSIIEFFVGPILGD
jgi:hypothetical protein